jgi:uncharacterized protein with von Willebrand factor type A (vWA) domain
VSPPAPVTPVALGLAGGPDLAVVVAAFGQLLHAAGVPVTPARSARFGAAVLTARPGTVDELYWLGRVTLLGDVGQVRVFDAVFGQVFRGWSDIAEGRGDTSQPTPAPPGRERPRPGPDQPPTGRDRPAGTPGGGRRAPDEDGRDDDEPASQTLLTTASDAERLHRTDFAALSAAELESLRELICALPTVLPSRPSRRRSRRRSGDELDLRAMLRLAHRTAGDPVTAVWRRRRVRPRRLVLIADVSGSMEPYARAYLHLLHGAVRATRAEAFVFSTRLTRLTRALATRDPDLALARAAAAAPDWSGGTRIGAALKAFNDGYGRRGTARGAVVVIVSDGWEHGDPAELAEQLARLSRLAARLVWVNPRKASPRYEPLAGGMAAALPYLDAFVSGHSLVALEEVLAAIRGPG